MSMMTGRQIILILGASSDLGTELIDRKTGDVCGKQSALQESVGTREVEESFVWKKNYGFLFREDFVFLASIVTGRACSER